MKNLFLLIALLTALSANAADIFVGKITTTLDDETSKMYALTDINDHIIGLRIDTYRTSAMKDLFETISWGEDEFEDLYHHGLVIEESDGHDVCLLKSSNLDPKHGGDLVIDYLYNGITGKRKTAHLELLPGTWRLEKNNKKVNTIHMKVRKMFGKVVGIKTVIFK
jgi:hypothetical protein